MRAIGVDFGTTNCALAACEARGHAPRLAEFDDLSGGTRTTFRSLLYFEREAGAPIREYAGPSAIQRYLGADEPGRLMQSLKSFLAARDFSVTSVFGTRYRLEGLIGVLLGQLRLGASASLHDLNGPTVVGRPVRFVSSRGPEDDKLALDRLRAAFYNGGFPEVEFEYEPVAAAYHYERSLDHDELILIADLGGGTSDFCLLQVGPSRRSRGASDLVLDTEGVPIAGDAFDARIVRHCVSPELGLGCKTISMFGNELDVPAWIYGHLERWHHLSFLRTPRSLQLLHDLIREARPSDRRRFEALLHLVQNNLGFTLYRSVERVKRELSSQTTSNLTLSYGPVQLSERVHRADFASWIGGELERIAHGVDRLLSRHGVCETDIDRVFLTGGTSFVRPLRSAFGERFGKHKLRTGEELTSVASGLALRALELR